MKLTTKIAVRIFKALEGLQGRQRVIETDGKPSSTAFEAFIFPTQTKVNIIRDLQILRPISDLADEAKKGFIRELSPDGSSQAIDSNPKLLQLFNTKHEELMATTHDVKGLLLVNWSDLDVAKVPAIVVEQLGILVRGLPKQDDADLVPEEPAAS